MYHVRYTSMKNTIVEAQGSEVQKCLMDMCKEEEKIRMAANGEDGTTSGWISLRSLMNLMMSSPRLSLSRMQVMIIAAEADVQDGRVNYWKFIPVVAKTIEMMFEPKALQKYFRSKIFHFLFICSWIFFVQSCFSLKSNQTLSKNNSELRIDIVLQ